jgi:Type II intron maturase
MPSVDPDDPDYRRLKYVRYADDWLIGCIGPRADVEAIKRQVGTFLRDELKLELSEEKTLITHARTEAARFLSYHISTMQANTYRPHGKRYVNGKVELRIPEDIVKQKCERYLKNGKPIHRKELETETPYSIISRYQAEYRGLVEYYQRANNLNRLKTLRWIMEVSLTKTLAAKLKLTVPKVYDIFQTIHMVDEKPYKGLQVIVPREGKKPLIAKWGNIPLKRNPRAILNDQPYVVWTGRTELEKRLLADTCELCGSHENISVHHIRALKDLHQKGRKEKPQWIHVMASRRRKTLVVCWSCHMNIQHGRPRKETKNSNSVSLESRIPGNS